MLGRLNPAQSYLVCRGGPDRDLTFPVPNPRKTTARKPVRRYGRFSSKWITSGLLVNPPGIRKFRLFGAPEALGD